MSTAQPSPPEFSAARFSDACLALQKLTGIDLDELTAEGKTIAGLLAAIEPLLDDLHISKCAYRRDALAVQGHVMVAGNAFHAALKGLLK